jgi:hypothetical protein
MMKQCTKCFIIKNIQFFQKEKKGYRSQCKECRYLQKRVNIDKKIKQINKVVINLTEKECNKCNVVLKIDNFTKLKSSKDGFNTFCKNCRKLKDRRLKELKKLPIEIILSNKICEKCKINKLISEFRVNRKSNDNHFSICNECWPEPLWNKEKQKAAEKKYLSKNKDKIKLKWKKDGQKINRKIRDSLNHRISGALKSINITKNNKTCTYLNCSIPFLKLWIEFQFQENMDWENYGKWELDHVKPCCSYNLGLIEEQLLCFHWSNLQPLWKEDNIKKGGKIDINLIEKHLEKANNFSAQVKEGELRGPPKVLTTNLS